MNELEDTKPSVDLKKENGEKALEVEEGEVVTTPKEEQIDNKMETDAPNGDDKGGKDNTKEIESSEENGKKEKKSKKSKDEKKKKKDKSKKKEKDKDKDKEKKAEKKSTKKEKESKSPDRKEIKKDKKKSASRSRSRSRHESRQKKKRSKSRSKDSRKRKEKERSSSRSRRRSRSHSKKRYNRDDGRYEDTKRSIGRSRDARRSRSPARRDKRDRVEESQNQKEKRDKYSREEASRKDKKIRDQGKEKEKKQEEVDDEPINEEELKKLEQIMEQEDEEEIARRRREERRMLLEKLSREAKPAQEEHREPMAVEQQIAENKEEQKIEEKKQKMKSVKQKEQKTALRSPDKISAQTSELKMDTRKDMNDSVEQLKEGAENTNLIGAEEDDKNEAEDISLKRKASSAHKHDVDKEKYIKLIENMRERLQKEEEDLREDDVEEDTKDKKKEEEEEKKEQNEDFDMFCETPESQEAEKLNMPIVNVDNQSYDDENGYYRAQIGELINGRYKILGKLGKGVFGNVFKGQDTQTNQEVAIKIVKSEEIYTMSGLKEKEMLSMLNEADRHNKRHVIRLLDSFDYRRHLMLVFELMEMDLRSVIKTFGKKLGLSIESVRSYSRQLFIALAHLKKYKVIHADLKPDNILVTNNKKTLKLSDFGSAFPIEENTITPYLVARYYRAPEIILGCPYDTAVDMWSAACTIFELYTGKILFPGKDNNDMLKMILQTKGRFNNKMLKRGEFSSKYFDHQNNFLSTELDPVTKEKYIKPIPIGNKITRDIGNLLNLVEIELSEEDKKKVAQLKDLLERCLTLDPNRRITPEEALRHQFINYNMQKLTLDQNALKHAF